MPSERKESPLSDHSIGSHGSAPMSTDGSTDTDVPQGKAWKGKATSRAQVKNPGKAAAGDGGAQEEGARLPGVRKAFRDPDSPGSSHRSLKSGRLGVSTNGDSSHLSVYSLGSSKGASEVTGSRLTIRPEIEIHVAGVLDKEYECLVCGHVLRYPILFDCGHRCCSSCLSELIRIEPRCPIDQTKVERDKVFVDKNFQKVLDDLPVFCSNSEKGCPWSATLKDLAIHLSECAFSLIDCPYHCEVKFERRFEEQHLAEDCPRRPVICAFCELMVTADIEADHREECHRFPVPCPNGCKHKEIPREECERKQMTSHNKTSAEHHLALVGESLGQWKRAFDLQTELLQQQTEKLAQAESRLEALARLYGAQMVWRIENYAEKRHDARIGKTTTIYSPVFYTHRQGYRMMASACLNGDGKARGKHMSLFVCICRGEYDSLVKWPFNYRVTFTLVDQCQDPAARRNVSYSIKPNICKENSSFLGRPTTDKNASFGSQRFVELVVLDNYDYLRDDCMFIKIVVDDEEMDVVS